MNTDYLFFLVVIPIVLAGAIVSTFIVVVTELVYERLFRVTKRHGITRLLVLLIIGLLVPSVLGLFMANRLGDPTCDEKDDGPYQACVSYRNDGYEPTYEQRKQEFERTFFVSAFYLSAITFASFPGDGKRNEIEESLKG